jgi:uncharacterized membrane protein YkoI
MKTLFFWVLLIWQLNGIVRADPQLLLAKISLEEATRQILKDGNKRVLGASTQVINGHEVHIIKVLTPDGRIQHYKIDAETGAVIG